MHCLGRHADASRNLPDLHTLGDERDQAQVGAWFPPATSTAGGQQLRALVEFFVGLQHQAPWNRDSERFRGFPAYRNFKFGRLFERWITWLRTLQHLVDIVGSAAVHLSEVDTEGHQPGNRIFETP